MEPSSPWTHRTMSDLTVEAPIPPRVSSQDRLLTMLQKRWPEYHPIVAMVEMAHDPLIEDDSLKFQCHKEVARYVVTVDKFVEVKSEVTKTKRVVVELFGGPDQPRAVALENDPAPVLGQAGVSDVVDKLAQRGEAELVAPAVRRAESRGVSVGTFEETTSVRSSGSVDADPLADAWEPDGAAARFG